MHKLAIGLFLVLFGIVGLLATKLPEWIIPAAALIAGGATLLEYRKS